MTDNALRDLLRAKEAELMAELGLLETPFEDAGAIGFGKRVGDGTAAAIERMTQVGAHAQIGEMLDQVRLALRRLDEGSYGRCDVCHELIPAGRLEARPWATRCVAHA